MVNHRQNQWWFLEALPVRRKTVCAILPVKSCNHKFMLENVRRSEGRSLKAPWPIAQAAGSPSSKALPRGRDVPWPLAKMGHRCHSSAHSAPHSMARLATARASSRLLPGLGHACSRRRWRVVHDTWPTRGGHV